MALRVRCLGLDTYEFDMIEQIFINIGDKMLIGKFGIMHCCLMNNLSLNLSNKELDYEL